MTYEYEVYNDGTNDYYTGRIIIQTYSNTDSIKFVYNDEGQTTAIQYKVSDVYQDRFLYEYDHMNNLAKLTDKTDASDVKTYSYIYDGLGRVRSVVDNTGDKISYTYGDDGNLSEFNINIDGFNRSVYYYYNTTTDLYDKTVYSANGNDVTKQYLYKANDDLKRLEKITLNTGSTIINQSFTYDDSNVYSSYGNATTRLRGISYDIANGTSYTYSYDEKGNITYIEVKDGSTIVEKYNYYYDDLNQLVREDIYTTTNEYTMVYDYDNYGNILSKKKYAYLNTSGTVLDELDYNYQTNGWNDQLIEFDGKTIEYDNLGNPTRIETDNSGYVLFDWEGRQLVEYKVHDSNNNVLKTITYKYNDQGIRTYKKVATDASNYDEYFYYLEGDAVLYEEINHIVDGVTSTDKIYYTYDIDGKLISLNLNGTEYFYIRNMQGDITKIVDKDGNIVVSYTYDAWGNIINTPSDTSGKNLAKLNPYRYRGYRYDEETSYYYLNSRYYNPEMGRFINADGLIGQQGDLLGHNMYAYTQNNPVMYVDLSGFWVDIAVDIAFLSWSISDLIQDPSDPWNYAAVVVDVVFLIVPIATGGSAAVKSIKASLSKYNKLEHAKDYGIAAYKTLKKATKGKAKRLGIEVHHIIEKRFLRHLGNTDEILSVVLTKSEHKVFTKAWRQKFKYGKDIYGDLKKVDVKNVADEIYKGYPELKKAAKEILEKFFG